MNRDGRTDGTQPVDGDDHDGCNVHGLRAFVPRLSLSQRQDDARGAREPTNPTWNPGALEPWSHGAMAWDFFQRKHRSWRAAGRTKQKNKNVSAGFARLLWLRRTQTAGETFRTMGHGHLASTKAPPRRPPFCRCSICSFICSFVY